MQPTEMLPSSPLPSSCSGIANPRSTRLSRPHIICFRQVPSQCLGLQPQIFQVNRQLSQGGLKILYNENYFRINIKPGDEDYCVDTPLGQPLMMEDGEDGIFSDQVQWKKFGGVQRFDIDVEFDQEWEYWSSRSLVCRVAAQLSNLSPLKHLQITLREDEKDCSGPFDDLNCDACVLRSLTILRNVAKVDISGDLSLERAQHLMNIIEGSSPRDHLPRMYDALEELTGYSSDYKHSLRWAAECMEASGADGFKKEREALIKRIVRRNTGLLNNLYGHHATPGTDLEWTIEQREKRLS